MYQKHIGKRQLTLEDVFCERSLTLFKFQSDLPINYEKIFFQEKFFFSKFSEKNFFQIFQKKVHQTVSPKVPPFCAFGQNRNSSTCRSQLVLNHFLFWFFFSLGSTHCLPLVLRAFITFWFPHH